jgi:hypothetical protein
MEALLIASFALASATPALACDCVRLIPGSPRFEDDIKRIVTFYPVVAEGVVESDGPYKWRFRPTREYRGPRQGSYRIELLSDCSLDPQALQSIIGNKVFLLLSEGEGQNRSSYEIQRCVNLLGADVERAIRARIGVNCDRR